MNLSQPALVQTSGTIRQLWSQTLAAAPRGLAFAREKGWLLAWDDKHWLYLFKGTGERQGQVQAPSGVTAACCADDGSAFAAAGSRGEVWWLAPDLATRWERKVTDRPLAAAMDPFGQYLAVTDGRGGLHIFDRHGRIVSEVQSPRPLRHLAFVPAAPFLIGSADYGLVACLDLTGRWIWRDGLVAHTGSLAVSGTGEPIVLACFTEGLQRYSLKGHNQGRLPVAEPCRLVALTFDGRLALAAGLANQLMLLDFDGRVLGTHLLEKPAAALAIGPLGDRAIVALADGPVIGFDLKVPDRINGT